jgi:hypothetical protein
LSKKPRSSSSSSSFASRSHLSLKKSFYVPPLVSLKFSPKTSTVSAKPVATKTNVAPSTKVSKLPTLTTSLRSQPSSSHPSSFLPAPSQKNGRALHPRFVLCLFARSLCSSPPGLFLFSYERCN